MKKISIAATLSVLANLGVVLGIVFLALVLRENSQLLSSQVRYNTLQNQMVVSPTLVQDGGLSDLLSRALSGRTIRLGESLRLRQLLIILLNTWKHEHGRLSNGELKVIS